MSFKACIYKYDQKRMSSYIFIKFYSINILYMSYNFIWIDVSNNTLDIHIKQSNTWLQVQNDYKTIFNFFKKEIKNFKNLIIISEATWVYSSSLVKVCSDLLIEHYEINPKAMNQLWKNIWDRNKTDKIDAEKIATVWKMLYIMEKEWEWKNKLTSTWSNDIKYLKSILSAIHSVKSDRQKCKQRIAAINKDIFTPKWFLKDMEKSILESEKVRIKLTEKAMIIIEKLGMKYKIKNLCTIPGVSSEVSLELIIFFIDISSKWIWINDRAKVKAFAWIDVSLQQSWTSINKKRISKQWNKHVRSILQVWWRCWFALVKRDKYKDTNLWLFFQRMIDKFSTPSKLNWNSISTAMSRKILLIAWWIFWNDTPYNWS